MITKFRLFEDKIRDRVFVKKSKDSNQDFYNQILSQNQKKFIVDKDFIKTMYIDGETLRFRWNHSPSHNLFEKIRDRTSLKSISEFNDIFVQTIKQIIPSKLKNVIDKDGCYALHLKENKFYILIQIDPEALINGFIVNYWGVSIEYHSFIVTIHNQSTIENFYKIIDIDDSEFRF